MKKGPKDVDMWPLGLRNIGILTIYALKSPPALAAIQILVLNVLKSSYTMISVAFLF